MFNHLLHSHTAETLFSLLANGLQAHTLYSTVSWLAMSTVSNFVTIKFGSGEFCGGCKLELFLFVLVVVTLENCYILFETLYLNFTGLVKMYTDKKCSWELSMRYSNNNECYMTIRLLYLE